MLIESGDAYKIYDLKNVLVKEVKTDKPVDARNTTDPTQVLDAFHLQNFFNAIRKGEKLNSDIVGGHQSTLLVQLGNIALRSGRALNIDPKNGHILNDSEATRLWSRDYQPGWEPKV
jgi:hypothetical protein